MRQDSVDEFSIGAYYEGEVFWTANFRSVIGLRADSYHFDVDSDLDADITYYYSSRLPGEPAAGVHDVHFHPMEPRTFRAYVTWNF